VISPVKVNPKAAPRTPLATVGKVATKAGLRQRIKKKTDFINEILVPEQTKKMRLEQVGRTTQEGMFRRNVVQQSPREAEIAVELKRLAIDPKRSYQYKPTLELFQYLGIKKQTDMPEYESVQKELDIFENSSEQTHDDREPK